MAVDFQKAFDSVDWSYRFSLLEKMNFGPKFIKYFGLLYKDLFAHERIGSAVSGTFQVRRGTRQGCPLSPLLFALIIEPLANWIRGDPLIWGFEWAGGVRIIRRRCPAVSGVAGPVRAQISPVATDFRQLYWPEDEPRQVTHLYYVQSRPRYILGSSITD